ncbi:MAG: DUF350 domain-containing protein [Saccharospirillaceae bacterium]|nr:DUF350 domain-containing protein [Pseudomonadales bacterium]NRB78917.1 DUF350 domain-containing protein [Saccharospirillaceae bacterium]
MDIMIMLVNFVYAVIGSLLAIVMMVLGYKLFDAITPFDTQKELKNGNIAVGIVIAGIFIGLGLTFGLVMGMGLN